MAKTTFLHTVERSNGNVILQAHAAGTKVEAQHMDNGLVRLIAGGEILAVSQSYVDLDEELTLTRWNAGGNPLARKPVRRTWEA